MKHTEILYWNGSVPPPEMIARIERFMKLCEAPDTYDRACDQVYVMVDADEITAVLALKRVLFSDGSVIPAFQHVILAPHIQRSKKALYFLMNAEQRLLEDGFKRMLAYILKQRGEIMTLALKFGFKEYAENDMGVFLQKNINNRRN